MPVLAALKNGAFDRKMTDGRTQTNGKFSEKPGQAAESKLIGEQLTRTGALCKQWFRRQRAIIFKSQAVNH